MHLAHAAFIQPSKTSGSEVMTQHCLRAHSHNLYQTDHTNITTKKEKEKNPNNRTTKMLSMNKV